jgi:hypothetical protein
VSRRSVSPRLAILGVAAALLVLGGCGSSDVQTDAAAFVSEHGATAVHTAAAVKVVDGELALLSSPPTPVQLHRLAQAVARARRAALRAAEWDVSKSSEGGEEGAEEEDLPRSETEATTAANELARAMSELEAYARAPSAAGLAAFRGKLAHAKELWDESVSQLWFLAHRSGAPNI